MNFAELLRTPVLQNTSGRLLLDSIKEEKDIQEFLNSRASVGHWNVEAGHWTLDFGRRTLTLDSERWTLDVGPWTLESGLWPLDSGPWTMDSGHWTLDVKILKFSTVQSFRCNEAMEIYQ